ncbi:hypothetical protein TNCV_2816231 [Trichonephila clavipes]|nr:hypothetical protein TNCV_2816231 [Trichonephila clavipes]
MREALLGASIVSDSFVGCVMCLTAWLQFRWTDGITNAVVLLARQGSRIKEDYNRASSIQKTSILATVPKRSS